MRKQVDENIVDQKKMGSSGGSSAGFTTASLAWRRMSQAEVVATNRIISTIIKIIADTF